MQLWLRGCIWEVGEEKLSIGMGQPRGDDGSGGGGGREMMQQEV